MLLSPYQQYSELVHSEINVLNTAREMRKRYGDRTVCQYIISHTETLSDLLEVALLQKETGMHEMLESRHGALILPQPISGKAASA